MNSPTAPWSQVCTVTVDGVPVVVAVCTGFTGGTAQIVDPGLYRWPLLFEPDPLPHWRTYGWAPDAAPSIDPRAVELPLQRWREYCRRQ